MSGLIHFYYGDGKGKTTAAMGLALRCLGHGKPVLLVQFLKDGTSGEVCYLRQLPGVQVLTAPHSGKFVFQMDEEEKEQCSRQQQDLLQQVEAIWKNQSDGLLILDEAGTACDVGMLQQHELCQRAEQWKALGEIVITGHACLLQLEELADYVTEMKAQKHPYQRGIAARAGIEH